MAKKKTFEEFREENLRKQEKLKEQMEQERMKMLQAQHCIDRAENQIRYQRKKKEKARTHRLITKGAAIEAICKDTSYLTEAEFYELMDEILNIPQIRFHARVGGMVVGRADKEMQEEQELKEAEKMILQNAVPDLKKDSVLQPELPDEEV